MSDHSTPVITVDGPGGSGKGTLSGMLAARLGWHLLDSGALYRLLAFAAQKRGTDLADELALVELAANLDVQFIADAEGGEQRIMLEGDDVSRTIRTETVGAGASRVAALPAVRQALLARQQAFREAPGLVADGRDMGTVVFPDAQLKIFLTASPEIRAERRYRQLLEKGETASLAGLLDEINARDERDMNRSIAPLRPAEDAVLIDSSHMSIENVLETVQAEARKRNLLG
ncbi:cytidylate kinase [Halopseudomonas formosensis]|uniref:Cytidylate kinase n=1 Tax=Halopseudomonas formosensis TaxID=1002526 RepID=A0A1I6B1P8_9GAMM|nr:(d)CMP kinase [Halopseudomonas formosensis]SFQ74850.1 cytidylate kinase [Halopseudomonas formosensis]